MDYYRTMLLESRARRISNRVSDLNISVGAGTDGLVVRDLTDREKVLFIYFEGGLSSLFYGEKIATKSHRAGLDLDTACENTIREYFLIKKPTPEVCERVIDFSEFDFDDDEECVSKRRSSNKPRPNVMYVGLAGRGSSSPRH